MPIYRCQCAAALRNRDPSLPHARRSHTHNACNAARPAIAIAIFHLIPHYVFVLPALVLKECASLSNNITSVYADPKRPASLRIPLLLPSCTALLPLRHGRQTPIKAGT